LYKKQQKNGSEELLCKGCFSNLAEEKSLPLEGKVPLGG
jgi:hypothetical protein